MTVGILTFWTVKDNYGQILQSFALQKYLQDMQIDARLIRYDDTEDYHYRSLQKRIYKILNPYKVFCYMKGKVQGLLIKSQLDKHDRDFDGFSRQYIKSWPEYYASYDELKSNPPDLDAYIVGSDQVWNVNLYAVRERYQNLLNAFFLNFGDEKVKRLSYAASWGSSSIGEKEMKDVQPLLKQFDYVSVREKSGVRLCMQCGCDHAEWVCDPTMLLTADKYRDIYENSRIRKPRSPFLLLYILSNTIDFNLDKVYEFAAEHNLDVIYVTGNNKADRREKFYATVPEWLYLIDNAQYVITNSFHGCVFSTIFKKRYAAIRLCKDAEHLNDRFYGLFEYCGMKERFLDENDFSVLDMPYENVVEKPNQFLDRLNGEKTYDSR